MVTSKLRILSTLALGLVLAMSSPAEAGIFRLVRKAVVAVKRHVPLVRRIGNCQASAHLVRTAAPATTSAAPQCRGGQCPTVTVGQPPDTYASSISEPLPPAE